MAGIVHQEDLWQLCRDELTGYLQPGFGCLRCRRRGCFVCFFCLVDALPEQCLRRRPGTDPFVAAVLELNGYRVEAFRLHVYAADVLVKRGVDGEGFR